MKTIKRYLKNIYYKISYPVFKTRSFVFTIIKWSKILWNDCDFDYSTIWIILKFKLQCVREHIDECANHVDYEKTVKEIKVAEDILERLIVDDYCGKKLEAHYKKWGNRLDKLTEVVHDGKSYLTMPSPSKEEKREFLAIIKKEESLRNKDMKELGTYLKDHIRNWWD